MNERHEKLSVIMRQNPEGDYKYLVRNSYAQGYTAYRTQRGFREFLKRSNVRIEFVEKHQSAKYGTIWIYDIIGTIEELSFWKKSEIPEGAIQYLNLSNGSYVDCYYLHTADGSKNYRPNPNAKEVYRPLTLDEHLAYQKVFG